jgi:protein tyrosine/serine phosphatase
MWRLPVHLVRRSLSRYTAALVVLALSSAPALAGDTSNIRIDNFGRVDDNYYRGGQPVGKDYEALAGAGIKTIISLTSDDAQPNEKAQAEAAGMKFFQIPMTTHQAPTATQIATFLAIVNNKDAQPVYVHCVGGRHRTGVMTAIYRMTNQNWSAAQAFAEMKTFKFGADFLHAEFKDFVLGYPAQLAHAAAAAAVTPKAGG